MTAHFINIHRDEFERCLDAISNFAEYSDEYYKYDWVEDKEKGWIRKKGDIKEYCYFLELHSDKYCLKIYSSIWRDTDVTRDVGSDAIRIVVASAQTGKPVRPGFTRIHRVQNWRNNLRARISEAVSSLGVDMTCPACKSILFLKRNKQKEVTFLGCSKYPKCRFTKNFS